MTPTAALRSALAQCQLINLSYDNPMAFAQRSAASKVGIVSSDGMARLPSTHHKCEPRLSNTPYEQGFSALGAACSNQDDRIDVSLVATNLA